jgi:nickel-dependent lactate racemase
MILFSKGSFTENLSMNDLKSGLFQALERLGGRKKVLALPPDITRFHSQAGPLTEFVWEYYKEKLTDILPATGTHYPMTESEIDMMFGKVPKYLFRVHDWRKGLATLGEVPSEYVREVSDGIVNYR